MSLGGGGTTSNTLYNSILADNGLITNNLVVDGSVFIGTNLDVSGSFVIDGGITISGDLIINDLSLTALEVSGNTLLNVCDISALTCLNDAQFDASLNVNGNVIVGGIMSALSSYVVQDSQFDASLNIGGNLNVAGDIIAPAGGQGELIYTNNTGEFQYLTLGASGEYLLSNGSVPQWSAIPPTPTPTLFQVMTAGNSAGNIAAGITNLPKISHPSAIEIDGSNATIVLSGNFVSITANQTFMGTGVSPLISTQLSTDTIILNSTIISSDATQLTLTSGNVNLSGSLFGNGTLSANRLTSTNMNNAGDFLSSSTKADRIDLEGGYRDSKNWLYMVGRSTAGATIAYGRIATDKAYFFTGQHPIIIKNSPTDLSNNHFGLIVSSAVDTDGYIQPPVINDSHIVAKLADTPKDRSVYGVFSFYDFMYQTSYDAKIPTENPWGKIYYANSTGEGMIYVSDLCGNMTAGDYITTCEIPGLGVKQDDDLQHSYTIAKLTQSVDFTSPTFQYWAYNDPTNPERTPDEIHIETAPKYETLYGRVYADKYVVYGEPTRIIERFNVMYDFAGLKPHLVGTEFKLALVGCVYQN
jgi:hypothetical protein